MPHAIALEGITRRFGAVHAVEDVSFSVPEGTIFGFMGHNGAGKTTTLRILLGLTSPTAGRASVFGLDCVRQSLEVRRITGFLPASYALPPEMTPTTFLHYVGALFGQSADEAAGRAERLLDTFGLSAVAHRKLGTFSTGMAQKVGLAQALMGNPRLLLLDEPTAGLDPNSSDEFCGLLRELHAALGLTVIMVTHDLDTLFALSTRVAVLADRHVITSGTPQQVARFEHPFVDHFFRGERGRRAMAQPPAAAPASKEA